MRDNRVRSTGEGGQVFQPDREAGITQIVGTSRFTILFLASQRKMPLVLRTICDLTRNLLSVWCLQLVMSCLKSPKLSPSLAFC